MIHCINLSNSNSKNPGVCISICLTTQNTPPCRQGAGRQILSGVQSEVIDADGSGRHGDMGKGFFGLHILPKSHQISYLSHDKKHINKNGDLVRKPISITKNHIFIHLT